MPSRSDTPRSTTTAPPEAPAKRRRTAGRGTSRGAGRGTGSSRRRARLAAEPVHVEHVEQMEHAPAVLAASNPAALYRAEKARRAANVDSAAMIEAKRLYDEAVAEAGKKRAGMRSSVASKRGAQRA